MTISVVTIPPKAELLLEAILQDETVLPLCAILLEQEIEDNG